MKIITWIFSLDLSNLMGSMCPLQGGTCLLQVGMYLLQGGTCLLQVGMSILQGGMCLLQGDMHILQGGTPILPHLFKGTYAVVFF